MLVSLICNVNSNITFCHNNLNSYFYDYFIHFKSIYLYSFNDFSDGLGNIPRVLSHDSRISENEISKNIMKIQPIRIIIMGLLFICTYTLNTRLSKLNFYTCKKKFIINCSISIHFSSI